MEECFASRVEGSMEYDEELESLFGEDLLMSTWRTATRRRDQRPDLSEFRQGGEDNNSGGLTLDLGYVEASAEAHKLSVGLLDWTSAAGLRKPGLRIEGFGCFGSSRLLASSLTPVPLETVRRSLRLGSCLRPASGFW